jgi:dihydroorotase
LETALGLSLLLVEEGALTLNQIVRALTSGPAEVFGLAKGTLLVGADADIAIVDPEAHWVVEPERFRSKGRNTPFGGWKLKGRVVKTLVAGRAVYP